MNLILLLVRASWTQLAVAVLTGLISGGTTARLITIINSAISQSFEQQNTTDNLVFKFALLILIVLVNSIISQVLLINLSEEAVYRLRLRLSQEILTSQVRHLEALGTPRLLATLIDDVAILSRTVYAISFICVDIAIIVGCLLYLAWLSSAVFAFTIGFILVAIGSIQLLINRAQHLLTVAKQQQERLFKHFRTITNGIKELKLHTARRHQFFCDELQHSAVISRNQNTAALLIFSISTGWGNILFFIFVGLLLFILPQLVATSGAVLSGYVLTITYLILPMQSLLDKLQELSKASVALQKINKMGKLLASQQETNLLVMSPPKHNWTKLELRQVTHTYFNEHEDNCFVLGPIDLNFSPGEIVFIVGGNGSGKSTLVKLITGLYIPESGEIYLDEQLITDENREWYRQHFSVIFSDFYILERLLSIRNRHLDEKVQEYLQHLNLDKKVRIENGKLSTTVLSKGQQKRLALLTAYLENRPIYLFDEWAADQDPLFRDIFYNQILINLKQRHKTVLVISHDDHYFHLGDRIIKLNYGKVESNQIIRHSS